MLELAGINFWAVGAVWLLYVVVGAFWYSPAGFGKQWERHTGIDMMKMPQQEATKAIASVAISALVQAITLAVLLNSLGVTNVTEGLRVSLLLWIGLVTATTVGVTLYSRKSWKFLWLNSSYFLIVMIAGAVILSVWR